MALRRLATHGRPSQKEEIDDTGPSKRFIQNRIALNNSSRTESHKNGMGGEAKCDPRDRNETRDAAAR